MESVGVKEAAEEGKIPDPSAIGTYGVRKYTHDNPSRFVVKEFALSEPRKVTVYIRTPAILTSFFRDRFDECRFFSPIE